MHTQAALITEAYNIVLSLHYIMNMHGCLDLKHSEHLNQKGVYAAGTVWSEYKKRVHAVVISFTKPYNIVFWAYCSELYMMDVKLVKCRVCCS